MNAQTKPQLVLAAFGIIVASLHSFIGATLGFIHGPYLYTL